MGKVKIELNSDGIKELLKSNEVQTEVHRVAEIVKRNAESMSGQQYGVRDHNDTDRAASNVYCETKEALKDCFNNNTLEKAKHT